MQRPRKIIHIFIFTAYTVFDNYNMKYINNFLPYIVWNGECKQTIRISLERCAVSMKEV